MEPTVAPKPWSQTVEPKPNLVFRDSCLITMSSLASACTSFGLLDTSKGFLPHRFSQNCASEQEIPHRLHGDG